MKVSLRTSLATLVGSVALFVAPAAFAAGEACFNDTDCPNPACGGDVCNWGVSQPMPLADPNKPYTCNPAGTDPKGTDGWCSDNATSEHCKCKAEGAKCVTVHCTFTKASDAPAGGGTGGAGTAGAPAAGASTAGASTAGSGTTTAPPADDGGCTMSVPGRTSTGIALGLGLAGLGIALLRRRR